MYRKAKQFQMTVSRQSDRKLSSMGHLTHFTDTMLEDISCEFRPHKGHNAILPFVSSLHLQMPTSILAEVDRTVEIELMMMVDLVLTETLALNEHCDAHAKIWQLLGATLSQGMHLFFFFDVLTAY